MVEVGKRAPAFNLPDADGKKHRLSAYKGQKVVLYFYPKDDTPGCTREACSFRDDIEAYEKAGAVVIGVSPDSPARHRKFTDKYDLPFTLLADEDHAIAEKYGVWKLKKRYGREYMGIERTTFIIDEQGKLARIFPNVRVDGHSKQVLAALDEI